MLGPRFREHILGQRVREHVLGPHDTVAGPRPRPLRPMGGAQDTMGFGRNEMYSLAAATAVAVIIAAAVVAGVVVAAAVAEATAVVATFESLLLSLAQE